MAKARSLPRSVPVSLALSAFLSSTSCGLIPSRLTDCSSERPCGEGYTCDLSTSTCVEVQEPVDSTAGPDLSLPTKLPDVLAPDCIGDCQPCANNAACQSQTCNFSQPSEKGGRCSSPTEVVYVDNHNGQSCTDGDGETMATAFCSLTNAMSRIDGVRKRVIRFLPSSADYGTVSVLDQLVAFIGPGGVGGSAFLRGGSGDAVTVLGNSRVFIDGVDVVYSNIGILCRGADSASLSVRRSRITNNADLGILVSGCTTSIDRVLLRNNRSGGLAIGGKTGYSITNSFIVQNGTSAQPAVNLASSGVGRFDFNTVADNTSSFSTGIECRSQNVTISNSIVIRNTRDASTSQITNCLISNTVVGPGDPAPGIQLEPSFVTVPGTDISYGLDAAPMRNAFCVNKAPCSLTEDYFGFPRPRGSSCDLGAHEVR